MLPTLKGIIQTKMSCSGQGQDGGGRKCGGGWGASDRAERISSKAGNAQRVLSTQEEGGGGGAQGHREIIERISQVVPQGSWNAGKRLGLLFVKIGGL